MTNEPSASEWEPDAAIGYGRINGRRWRCTDPNIPDTLRQELVNVLMQGRRELRVSKGSQAPGSSHPARRKVHTAKVALGERGPRWWEAMSDSDIEMRMKASLIALLSSRGVEKTVCPSEIVRVTRGADWRPLLPVIRNLAFELSELQQLRILQKGKSAGPHCRGPIRIAQGDRFTDLRID